MQTLTEVAKDLIRWERTPLPGGAHRIHGIANWTSKLERIDAALSGKLPAPSVPEGWQLVPHTPTSEMCAAFHKADSYWEDGWAFDDNGNRHNSPVYQWVAMLAAAPKSEGGA